MFMPHRIYELAGCSVCSLSFFVPVEAVSPPYGRAQSRKIKAQEGEENGIGIKSFCSFFKEQVSTKI
jgi:hypothetical protein